MAVSILYVVPLLLTYPSPRTKDPLYFSAVATVLTWADVLLKPPGLPIPYALFNRTLGTTVIWVIALGLVMYKRTQRELKSAQIEQAHAEGLMIAAQEARDHADREAVRALVGREAAEEQLLINRLRLESIIESAMDAIITVDEDQSVVLFNRAAEQMFGCSTREAIGQPLDRFLPQRFHEAHYHHVQTFGQSGVTSRKMGKLGTVMGLRSNGEEFPIEAAISHIAVERKTFYTVILRDVTDRKQSEEVLQVKESFTRDVLDSLPAHICVLNQAGVILRTNDAWRRFAHENSDPGSTIGDVGDNYLDVCRRAIARGDSTADSILHGIEAVIEGSEQSFSAEYACHSPKEPRWFLLRVTPLKTASGVVLAHLNISVRKQAEEALRESQRQLATLISNLPGFVYRSRNDRNWTFEYLSEGVSDLTGYPVEEYLVQRTISYGENTHPGDRERIWQEVQTAVGQHRPFEMTYRILAKSGEVKWVWERGEGIYAQDGTLNYLEGFVTDVTERKRAEHLLRQSEERYRRLIAISPYAILVTRGEHIIFANDQAIKLFGAVKADEILGKSPVDLVHPGYHAIVGERMHELLEGSPQVPMIEEKILTLDGRAVDVEVGAARFVDEEGPAILVMLRDISERKRLQEQLRKTERIAELGTLASGMAHEIGTPMNVILGRAEYLMDRVTEEPVKKGLQTIVTQVERITKVMNQLLTFARRKAPERCPLDLRGTIEDGMELFQERLARNQIQVELALADDCPLALADPDQMSQVFINLVMNAVHAMPDGGTLRIGLAPEKQMVKLTIADTGHGIPRDVIEKVFEPFYTTKEFGQGTGLGLTVVKGIIEEHQGSIVVESREGKGTTFTILIPQADSQWRLSPVASCNS
jgi:PAS domain S-box-containing protein